MLYRWILNKNGTWHAWPIRGRSTQCGYVNVEHLKRQPAVDIQPTPAPGGKICRSCARKSGYVVATATCGDPTIAAWIGAIGRHLKHIHVRVGVDTVKVLAEKLAEVGPPESVAARDAFAQIQQLFLRPLRTRKKYLTGHERTNTTIPFLKETLTQIESLPKVLAAFGAWQRITQRDPMVERFRPDRVVGVMMRVPDPEAYVAHLVGRGLPTLAAIFHPNTLERAQRDTALRGMFAGNGQYLAATATQLHVIED